jgi:hypothetical protein
MKLKSVFYRNLLFLSPIIIIYTIFIYIYTINSTIPKVQFWVDYSESNLCKLLQIMETGDGSGSGVPVKKSATAAATAAAIAAAAAASSGSTPNLLADDAARIIAENAAAAAAARADLLKRTPPRRRRLSTNGSILSSGNGAL